MLVDFEKNFYTWDEVVEKYPDKWVVFEDARLDAGRFIIDGTLIAVGDYKEIDSFMVECYRAGRKISHQRTTDTGSVGVLTVEGIEVDFE